ncbi:MAG: alcohol dehydrogenase catalytic domain-containing protein [Spirochaetales bacterium]|nr:alcohol dehydrogenase catalytic domain-containing protein [Spirochaetales bacterium]
MKGKMKAQVFYDAENMKLEEVDIPQISDVEVLVKVKYVGICGSDVSYYFGMSPLDTANGKGPLILGHEFTGEVVEVGAVPKALGLFKPGDRVVVNPVQYCNACYACAEGNTHCCTNMSVNGVSKNGAFAEYAASLYTGLFKLPDDVSYSDGAFIEPLACAVNGMNKLEIEPGQFTVVFGPGAIGLMMVQMAKSMGAGKVLLVGTRDYRLEMGKKAGADYLINVFDKKSPYYKEDVRAAVAELTGGKLADRAICPTGSNEGFELAVEICGNCSIIVHFGLPDGDAKFCIPALKFHTMDKQIRSAWLAPGVWPQTLRMVKEGLVDVSSLVTHTVPLEDTGKAIESLKSKENNPMKVQVKIS